MSTSHVRPLALAAGALLALGAAGCNRGDDHETGGLVENEARIRQQQAAVQSDSAVVNALKTPQGPDRIIYDKPVDLSYATAVARRPDLTNLDTIRARMAAAAAAAAAAPPPAAPKTGTTSAATQTSSNPTGGDASRDTSGGAARGGKKLKP